MKNYLLVSACVLTMLSTPARSSEDLPSREEMWKMIQMQQRQIKELQGLVKTQDDKIEAASEEINEKMALTEQKALQAADIAEETRQAVAGIEPAAGHDSGGHSHGGRGWWEKTSVGGYGELHYNGGASDTIDLHRFVVGLNHEFNEDVRFVGEIEIEHALSGDGEPGEVEIEQAYVEFDLTDDDAHRAKAGVFLIPVGILNEIHEPTTYFGVERNPVENNIVPTTWWEGGVALSGRLGQTGIGYDLAAHSGLQTPATGGNAYRIRNGRQKVASAEATDPAYTARLRWTGYPGVELGVTGHHQTDLTQNANDNTDIDANLIEAHANLRRGGLGLRALYALWDVDGDAPAAIGRDEQMGWYVEPSYRFDTDMGEIGVFSRYNEWDNNAGISNSATEFEQTDVGLNYWPVENVVLKGDFAFIDGPTDATDDERLNLGVGWQF